MRKIKRRGPLSSANDERSDILDLTQFATMDAAMLLSIINMKLRNDFNGDLDKLVAFFEIDKAALEAKLASAGFEFIPSIGQFR